MAQRFAGKIALDVRDSVADWAPYETPKAPEGAPNILVVLYDDTGQATWSPYGGRVNMPTLDRLAANGLTYTQWHTTALCSPTRAALLTGRNPTSVGGRTPVAIARYRRTTRSEHRKKALTPHAVRTPTITTMIPEVDPDLGNH